MKPLLASGLLLFITNISVNEATCKEEKITWGSALVNHTYKTIHADYFVGCLMKCDQDPQCRSCNFWWNKLECELNFAAKYSAPTSLISKVNCVHRDMDSQPGKHVNLAAFTRDDGYSRVRWTHQNLDNNSGHGFRTCPISQLFAVCSLISVSIR